MSKDGGSMARLDTDKGTNIGMLGCCAKEEYLNGMSRRNAAWLRSRI